MTNWTRINLFCFTQQEGRRVFPCTSYHILFNIGKTKLTLCTYFKLWINQPTMANKLAQLLMKELCIYGKGIGIYKLINRYLKIF